MNFVIIFGPPAVGKMRLYEKPSKRDTENSRARMLEDCERHKLNTDGDFYYENNYIKIDNTDLSPEEAARRIVDAFGLPTADATSGSAE